MTNPKTSKPSNRPDRVKKPKTPQTARSKQLWIHNPDPKKVKKWVELAAKAYAAIPWSAPTRGEKRVKQANALAVEYQVHREIVYVLRRAHHFFQDQLGAVLQDIGLHRLSVLLMAHDKAKAFYNDGVPAKRGGRRKAVRLYKTEELRYTLRKLLVRSKRELAGRDEESEMTMRIVRGTKFRSGTLEENLKRILADLDTGFAQALKRVRAGKHPDRTNRPATVEKFLDKLDQHLKEFRRDLRQSEPGKRVAAKK